MTCTGMTSTQTLNILSDWNATGSSNAGPNNNPKKMARYPQPQVILPQIPNVPAPHNNGPPIPGMSSLGPPNTANMNTEDESSSESAGKDEHSKASIKCCYSVSLRYWRGD